MEIDGKEVGWKWVVRTGSLIAVFYYMGFSQWWFYPMLCFVVAAGLMVATGRISIWKSGWVVAALLFGLALLFPLLYQQMRWAIRSAASARLRLWHGNGPLGHGVSLSLDRRRFRMPGAMPTGNSARKCTTRALCFAWRHSSASASWWPIAGNGMSWGETCGCFVRGFAILLALGKPGIVWPAMAHVPVLEKTSNNPFRALPCFNLCAVLAGRNSGRAHAADDVARAPVGRGPECGGHGPVAVPRVPCAAQFLLVLGPTLPPIATSDVGDPETRRPGKTAALYRDCSIVSSAPGYPLSMARGFPSYYSVCRFDGYDPLVESKPEIVGNAKNVFGADGGGAGLWVQWVVVDRAIEKPLPNILPHERMVLHSRRGTGPGQCIAAGAAVAGS